jgi:cell division protein FtsZ
MRFAEAGITELHKCVDTLLIIPNQNLFRVANEKTTFADAFAMADQVLYSGVACITDLMVKEGLINLDFADVRAVMREMGKAMMGTGESSGEKRALTAAEAAISNPLIDDSSMKGARGLLISITGGRDLTLYEVDEAATRIREEVDQDANIIVGATFDETLDGLIRVSVVATGIEHAQITRGASPATESRIAELTQKLRADTQRLAERIERTPAGAHHATSHAVESAAKAAIAAAVLPGAIEDVTIRPISPKPSLFLDAGVTESPVHDSTPKTFIPPQAERIPTRTPRMPRMDELPIPAQNEIRARRGELPETDHPEKRRMTLLQRLAAVGLGRRDGESEETEARHARPAPQAAAPTRPAPPRSYEPRGPEPVSEYAKRAAPQGLDSHGRQAPVHYLQQDDQLDIPAFLRRQST